MHVETWWGKLREKHHLENLDGNRYQDGSSRNTMADADWTDTAQNLEKWRAFVNMVTKLQVP